MRIKLHHWLLVSTLPVLAGCYPKGAEYAEELDLVYTNYDNTFSFSSKHTYALSDSVIKITGENFQGQGGISKPDFEASSFSVPIVQAIDQNMTSYGWTKVNKNSNPDVIMLASTTTTLNLFYYYDWGYWGWYYPGWYPGWGWYYPYYPYPSVTGYRSGSVFIQMVDDAQRRAGDTAKIPVRWSAIINGLAEGSNANITTRIQSTIAQAYQQSPYLKH